MFVLTCLAAMSLVLGFGKSFPNIIVALSMIVLPGIPMVNSVRNIFCGNEMNGILQLLKVFLESLSMVAGIYIGMQVLGGFVQW